MRQTQRQTHRGDTSQSKKTRSQHDLDDEFNQMHKQIVQRLDHINKHEKIKVQGWLKKLEMRVDNVVWKQNRNFYCQVLNEMLLTRCILEPFNKVPPQGPLPRFTAYDVPYPLRTKFLNESEKQHAKPQLSKNNSLENSFVSTRRVSMCDKENQQSFGNVSGRLSDLSKLARQRKSCRKEVSFLNNSNEGQESVETLRKDIYRRVGLTDITKEEEPKSTPDTSFKIHNEQLIESKTFSLLKRSFKFMMRNYDILQQQPDYKDIISDIVRLGDQRQVDLRTMNVELSPSPSKIVFKKYSQRIKENFQRTGAESKQFMQFLSILRQRPC